MPQEVEQQQFEYQSDRHCSKTAAVPLIRDDAFEYQSDRHCSKTPFHAEVIAHTMAHGFDYMGMITVVTDVVRENNQTYRLGWSEQCKDGTKMGVGSPEYILLFHKPQTDRTRGYADVPVVKSKEDYSRARWQVDAHAFWRSSGERNLATEELMEVPTAEIGRVFSEATLRHIYDYKAHIRIGEHLDGEGRLPSTFMALAPASWADGVWTDVNRMLTLNTEQSKRRLQMHVCPLQFDIADRLINRYSNPGELVYDPFGGLMTVPLRALKLGRRGLGWFEYQSDRHCSKTKTSTLKGGNEFEYQSDRHCSKTRTFA